ncbi:leucine-rich repeat-containing protein 58 [Cimex lectularius]|uniref:Leucine-rich repeat-containing protein 58 n=1 Tax=Cimex lectularius TaxID=79782 RepID=A0A8I6TIP0_CIMLE|nr:leucine-rich repeat-containing protein 58 [Cimex lectularius]
MDLYSSDSTDSSGPEVAFNTIDLSYHRLSQEAFEDKMLAFEEERRNMHRVHKLLIKCNQLSFLPSCISSLHNLRHVDVSNNRLTSLPEFFTRFPLVTLNLRNNSISNENLPKTFASWSRSLRKLNLGGNALNVFPEQCLELEALQQLYMGSNAIEHIPKSIERISGLMVLCLGGNRLSEVPETVGNLNNLEVLILNDNMLESLPRTIASLKKLKSLQLHNNLLRTLPTEIITLKHLSELSLRDNPLVIRFVNDMTLNPGTLLEIAARAVKVQNIPYVADDLPKTLRDYLNTAHHCLNPKCNGVFFDNRVEHIKFVDFCGKYRVPLLQYLCSAKCVNDDSALFSSPDHGMMRKVLLG